MKFPFQESIFSDLPRAYLVGGSVRDIVRGTKPLDYDVAVHGDPLPFARLMAKRLQGKIVILGKGQFSVYRVVSKTQTIDVTPLKGNDLAEDLKARDFTVNALAWDLTNGRIIDHFGGMQDLKANRVRMVSVDAFADDPARLIRAFRMAATMDFHIEPITLQAITRQADAIRRIAGERVWAELKLILTCPQSLPAVRLMAESQLLFHIIPELRSMVGCKQNRHHNADVFTHTLQAYQALELFLADQRRLDPQSTAEWVSAIPLSDRVDIKFALLLHDTGKPGTRNVTEQGRVHFFGHAASGAALSKLICQRLRTSNRRKDRIESIIRHHQRPLALFLAKQESGLRPKTLGRFFRQCADLTPMILLHAIADEMGKGDPKEDPLNERIVFYQDLMEKYLSATTDNAIFPLVNGQDLMDIFGLSPSPRLGRILNSVKEFQMAGALENREQAVQWVADYLHEKRGESDK